MSEIRLLVIEDDTDGAAVVQMMLESVGVEAVLANTGEDGLAALKSEPSGYNGVLIDLALPGMDGFELMETIREHPALADLPLVAMTAFHTPELKNKALDAGFDSYFPKPLDTTIFIGALERLLG